MQKERGSWHFSSRKQDSQRQRATSCVDVPSPEAGSGRGSLHRRPPASRRRGFLSKYANLACSPSVSQKLSAKEAPPNLGAVQRIHLLMQAQPSLLLWLLNTLATIGTAGEFVLGVLAGMWAKGVAQPDHAQGCSRTRGFSSRK